MWTSAGQGAFAVVFFLSTITQSFQVCGDGFFQARRLDELSVQLGNETRHLFLKRVAVVFDFLCADVAAGR